jgi:hypothetical protein
MIVLTRRLEGRVSSRWKKESVRMNTVVNWAKSFSTVTTVSVLTSKPGHRNDRNNAEVRAPCRSVSRHHVPSILPCLCTSKGEDSLVQLTDLGVDKVGCRNGVAWSSEAVLNLSVRLASRDYEVNRDLADRTCGVDLNLGRLSSNDRREDKGRGAVKMEFIQKG